MNDLFSIFNPDWWMNESNKALQMADAILFLLFLLPVLYLLIYSVASLRKYKNPYPQAEIQHRFLVLFTVLRNGQEVINSINDFLDTQLYPRNKFDVAVAATQLPEEDLIALLQMPVNIVVPDKENCSKLYAIQQVMERYSPNEYDMVVVFNSDNRIVPNALELFNNAYFSGCDSIQAHRMAENLNTSIAVLNAVSEEINNHIFRKGQVLLGFSSALIGSGMAFDFAMFHEISPILKGSDFSKSTEIALLEQNIYTEYLEEIVCYSKKQDSAFGYTEERQRWRSSQLSSTVIALKKLPLAFLQGRWDYCNKLVQWLMPSRFLLIGLLIVATVSITAIDWTVSLKWYILLVATILSFLMALPEGEVTKQLKKAIWSLPILFFVSIFSNFKKVSKKE